MLFLNLASAQIETKYHIYEKKVLVEYYFDEVSNFELRIPYDIVKPEVSLNYELEEKEGNKFIKINSGKNFSIKYITESMIDKSKKGYYFTSKNYLNELQNVKLVLSETAILVKDGIVFPLDYALETDGRSIILKWKNYNESQIVVNYEFKGKNDFIYYVIFVFVFLVFFIYSIFQKRRSKQETKKTKMKQSSEKIVKKKKEFLTKNLFEEEKKIVEYLFAKKGKEAWTKKIAKELEISKVKLSRKLKSLEKKELIKKIPYGNENKIRLLKKR